MNGQHPVTGVRRVDVRNSPDIPVRPLQLYPTDLCNFPGGDEEELTEATPSASSALAADLGRGPEDSMVEDELTEAKAPRSAPAPEEPSSSEVEAHQLAGHACFRSWCRHCVRGRGCEAAHSSTKPPATALPVLSWDYCFLSSKNDKDRRASDEEAERDGQTPVLAMWDSRSKGFYAHFVPAKGVDNPSLTTS